MFDSVCRMFALEADDYVRRNYRMPEDASMSRVSAFLAVSITIALTRRNVKTKRAEINIEFNRGTLFEIGDAICALGGARLDAGKCQTVVKLRIRFVRCRNNQQIESKLSQNETPTEH